MNKNEINSKKSMKAFFKVTGARMLRSTHGAWVDRKELAHRQRIRRIIIKTELCITQKHRILFYLIMNKLRM